MVSASVLYPMGELSLLVQNDAICSEREFSAGRMKQFQFNSRSKFCIPSGQLNSSFYLEGSQFTPIWVLPNCVCKFLHAPIIAGH